MKFALTTNAAFSEKLVDNKLYKDLLTFLASEQKSFLDGDYDEDDEDEEQNIMAYYNRYRTDSSDVRRAHPRAHRRVYGQTTSSDRETEEESSEDEADVPTQRKTILASYKDYRARKSTGRKNKGKQRAEEPLEAQRADIDLTP